MLKTSDITIVGGGIIGLMCAARLAWLVEDLEISVIQDKAPTLSWGIDELPDRVSAVNRRSQQFFQMLGLWEQVLEEAAPYFHMTVKDQGSGGAVEFDRREVRELDLGHIVTNRVLQKTLWMHLSNKPHVHLETGSIPVSLEIQHKWADLHLPEKIIRSRLLIGADGATSWVHKQLKFAHYEQNYGHSALTACVKLEKPHHQTAYQHFFEGEILAFLPLKNLHQASIVWSAPPQRSEYLKNLSLDGFNNALMKGAEDQFGRIECISDRVLYPLIMRHSKSYVKERVALIGDAIHTIHPLAGQGLNLGLQDAACLVDFIKESHECGRDIGSLAVLRQYERFRVGDNWKMIVAMEGLKNFFCHPWRALMPFRKFGMKQIHRNGLVKKYLIQKALGI